MRLWDGRSTVATDSSLHQLAPYIGRVKPSIARALVRKLTRQSETVLDPFCGSGVIPFEATILGRHAIASDWNPYAVALTKAKLTAPPKLEHALKHLDRRWLESRSALGRQDLRCVPQWVRNFFHSSTLRSALAFRDVCCERRDHFLLACLLGILHHQRPGFLSYPSSHLVPYLRDKLFPPDQHPHLYEERDVFSRLRAKVIRSYRRAPADTATRTTVRQSDARHLTLSGSVDAIITSPPYMNALEYVRDNRLRLWFVSRSLPAAIDLPRRDVAWHFERLMQAVCVRLARHIRPAGHFALLLGDCSRGNPSASTTDVVKSIFAAAPDLRSFSLTDEIRDVVPDVRRARRDCRATRVETTLVYRKARSRA